VTQPEPTVAEERFAKMIAMWHGQTTLYYKPGGEGRVTVASWRGTGTGFSYEVDNYVNKHWREYLAAARAVLEIR
jgi:hypothetical protein